MKRINNYLLFGGIAYLVTNAALFVWMLLFGELISSYKDILNYNPIAIIAGYFFGLSAYKYGYTTWIIGNILLTIGLCLVKTGKEKVLLRITSNLGFNILLLVLTPAFSIFFLVLMGFRTPS